MSGSRGFGTLGGSHRVAVDSRRALVALCSNRVPVARPPRSRCFPVEFPSRSRRVPSGSRVPCRITAGPRRVPVGSCQTPLELLLGPGELLSISRRFTVVLSSRSGRVPVGLLSCSRWALVSSCGRSHGLPWVPVEFTSGSRRIVVGSPCVPVGVVFGSRRVPVGFQSSSCRVPVGFSSRSDRVLVGLQSGSYRVPVGCP